MSAPSDGARADARKRLAAEVVAPDEQIVAVLGAHIDPHAKVHAGDPWKYDGTYACSCGEEFKAFPGLGGLFPAHRAHVADALAGVIADAKAEAWDEGNNAGYSDAVFDDRGFPDDDDADPHPHENPYRVVTS